ncbi:MAG: ThuA domain-containing protein [Planctomycetes bacterium]|nr:ThuA domain-containing protein [Planctomycetota bacterium]
MGRHGFLLLLLLAVLPPQVAWGQKRPRRPFVVSEQVRRAIEQAAPAVPFVTPARPRRVLIYGRWPTHPESVACCFAALEILGRKTGAFEVVCSGDPEVFSPNNIKRFDAAVMNNTHERHPLLPLGFQDLPPEPRARAESREPVLQKSLLEFVAGGKGIVGIHGAVAGGIRWPEYLEMMGGAYAGHFAGAVWVRPEEPDHPLCRFLAGESFAVRDEIYMFKESFARRRVRVLLCLDLEKKPDPGKRSDRDYVVSWVKSYGRGRVFYCSLGHSLSAYKNPYVLRHYLAGIQFAAGDFPAPAAPR